MCVEFPLKGDNTPKGKYRINIRVKSTSTEVKRISKNFSINLLCELIPEIGYAKIPMQVLTRWALNKLKNWRIQVTRADILYIGTSSAAQSVAYSAGKKIEDVYKVEWSHMGAALPGLADGVLGEMLDSTSPHLTLTVI